MSEPDQPNEEERQRLEELSRAIRGMQELHRWQGLLLDSARAQIELLLGSWPGPGREDVARQQ